MNLLNFPYNLQDMMKEEESHPTNLPPKNKTDEHKPQNEAAEKKSTTAPNDAKRKSPFETDSDKN